MKRQNVRKLILLVSLLLLPVTLFYFSPVLIIEGAAVGVVTGSAMMFLLLFISGMIFGRGACGWIMACGGFQEMLAGVNDNPLKAEKKKWIRWMIWGSWFTGVITVIITFGAHDFKPFFMTSYGVSVAQPWEYIIYYAVLLVIGGVALATGRRGFCAYGCWMSPFMVLGRKFADALRLPGLRLIKKGTETCIGCGRCTNACPSSLNVQNLMQSGTNGHPECILCGNCADVCPKKLPGFALRCLK
jgi:polyferredoxin